MTPDEETKGPQRDTLQSDPDAAPSEEEVRAAEELRLALGDAASNHDDVALVRALNLAHAPQEIGKSEHAFLVARALATPRKQASIEPASAAGARPRGRVIRVAFGVAAVVTLAAGIAFVIGRSDLGAERATVAENAPASLPLVHVRSTQPLFAAPFAAKGGTSARIDRIAMARESDLRDNRFARWGVR